MSRNDGFERLSLEAIFVRMFALLLLGLLGVVVLLVCDARTFWFSLTD